MTSFVGLAAALGAAFAFGVQYVPVKKYEIYDGTTFQWFMCSGILFVGMLVALADGINECPLQVICGGVLFAISNYLVLPVVKILGIGLGFSMYHFVNMAVAYCVGRFGLFGIPPSVEVFQGSLFLCDVGFVLVLASFVGLLFVEQEHSTTFDLKQPLPPPVVEGIDEQYRAMYRRWRLGESRGATDLPVFSLDDDLEFIRVNVGQQFSVGGWGVFGAPSPALPPLVDNENNETRAQPSNLQEQHIPSRPGQNASPNVSMCIERAQSEPIEGTPASPGMQRPWSTTARRSKLLGVVLAVLTGALTGIQSVPATLFNHAHPETPATAVVLPQCFGIWLASTCIYLLYSSFARWRRWRVPHAVIRPAFFSGCIWASGWCMMILGILKLGFTAGYTIDAVGPIIVSSILSIFVFKEITGRRQLALYVLVEVVQLIGVVLIAGFSKEG